MKLSFLSLYTLLTCHTLHVFGNVIGTYSVIDTLPVGTGPAYVAIDGTTAVVSVSGGLGVGAVNIIDLTTRTVSHVISGFAGAYPIALSGTTGCVENVGGGSIELLILQLALLPQV